MSELFACAKCGLEKPREAFEPLQKKTARRIRSGAACLECKKLHDAEYYQRNKERAAAQGKARYERNREQVAAWGREYRAKNADKKREQDRAYCEANKEQINARRKLYREANKEVNEQSKRLCYDRKKEQYSAKNAEWKQANREKGRLALREWKKRNPHKVSIDRVARRAASRFATPSWADHEKIREVYATADLLNMVTGQWHHVDHIVPLRSPLVQGFAGNLVPRRSFVGPLFRVVQGLHVEANLCILDGSTNMAKNNRYWPDMPEWS